MQRLDLRVEFAALSGDELPGLIAYLAAKPCLPFRERARAGQDRGLDEAAGARLLNELRLGVGSIVAHPDTLAEPAHYREIGPPLVLENMDDRKSGGRTADERAPVFAELPEPGSAFDIAHASSIDPTMGAAGELLDRFRSRLRHVHLSPETEGTTPRLHQTMRSDSHRSAHLAATCRGSSKHRRHRGGRTS